MPIKSLLVPISGYPWFISGYYRPALVAITDRHESMLSMFPVPIFFTWDPVEQLRLPLHMIGADEFCKHGIDTVSARYRHGIPDHHKNQCFCERGIDAVSARYRHGVPDHHENHGFCESSIDAVSKGYP